MQNKVTPAMQQYMEIKNKYPDCLVLFRMGDFYETFYEDAKKASVALEITLTSRGFKNGPKIPLAGIPYHALDNYLSKLIQKGIKVAIVEQLEDPKLAKGVVKRDVVRIVTPGTIIETHILDEKNNNFIGAISYDGKFGLSVVDLSTGEFNLTETDNIINEISKWNPKEILIPMLLDNHEVIKLLEKNGYFINKYEDRLFLFSHAYKKLVEHFQTHSLEGFGLENKKLAVSSAGALINYLYETQKKSLNHINNIKYYNESDYMLIDSVTIRNLELINNIRDGSTKNTLLSILDNTCTPMGSRLLKKWILTPLIDLGQINKRLFSVEEIFNNPIMRSDLTNNLQNIKDIERLTCKINLGSANPRDLIGLKLSLMQINPILEILKNANSDILNGIKKITNLDIIYDVIKLIEDAIIDEPPILIREGGIIKRNYNNELDEIHEIITNGKQFIRKLEEEEKRKTGITNLKIGFNRVFGYFFEITNKNINLVPSYYIRKQTMSNCERFITEDLKIMEEKILSAEEKINTLEYELFSKVIKKISDQTELIQNIANQIASIDCINSFARVAINNRYTKPSLHKGYEIDLKNARHPVIEKLEEYFIPNDIKINEDNHLMIITGPNMAGKSTIMRVVSLITLMAQIGSFVPTDHAKISIVDRIFSRVGAHDDITHGQSTFMVEMNEVASILNNATEKSLIIMDEIGRGTSTFDGVSIAWAVAEYINKNIKSKTLFATHYHVLTNLESLKGVKNYNILIKEDDDEIIFLRKLVEGGTDKSYGIHVAKLAGMPKKVIEMAKEIQFKLEDKDDMKKRIVVEKKENHGIIEYSKSVQKTLLNL